VLQDENVHTTIPAFSNYDELQEDLSIMDNLALTPEERQDLRRGETLGLSGMYCQQCSRCVAQCPAGMDIPTLMRASMYAFGHERPERARDTLRAWTPADIACRRCGKCDVQCSLGLDVRSKALAMASLLDAPKELVALS
jgi:predicted aldo/keto reductase-like oxidoreductase